MVPEEIRSEVAVNADCLRAVKVMVTVVSAPPIGIDKKAKGNDPDSLSRLQ